MLQLLEEHLKFETQEAFLTGKSSDEGLVPNMYSSSSWANPSTSPTETGAYP
jgi:hypothetical protein